VTEQNSRLEIATLVHVALLGVVSTWAFGGGADWAVTLLSIIGSFAPVITWFAFQKRRSAGQRTPGALLALWPLLGFNTLVVLGTFQPSLRIATIEGARIFIPRDDLTVWPSSARPDLAFTQLWLFDAIALSCLNLLLTILHRRSLCTLLLILGANALLLAIFGSLQKFVGSTGLFFGRVHSPNTSFFASFIYHNHWGAYVALMLAITIGLLFSLRPWSGYRDFWHSPALAAVVGIFFLAVTIPLSGSRSCSILAVLLLTAALIHGLRRVALHQQGFGKSTRGPLAFLALAIVVSLTFLVILARQSIETRVADTQEQLARMRVEGSIGGRAQLYGDTWHMACARPWFGWGLGSYGTAFAFYNTQHSVDNLPQYYENAHSDWLQFIAETGAIGTFFLLGFLLVPLLQLRKLRQITALPLYLFGGCGLILLYAGIEFPFGNPAVTIAFWSCLFAAVRWSQIDQRERTG